MGNVVVLGSEPFAHGGSGIFVSRGAVQKMMDAYENCEKITEGKHLGDHRIGVCLHSVGVEPKGLPHSGNYPDETYSWPEDACARPVSFHHISPVSMHRLYKAANKTEAATFADVAREFMSAAYFKEKMGKPYQCIKLD